MIGENDTVVNKRIIQLFDDIKMKSTLKGYRYLLTSVNMLYHHKKYKKKIYAELFLDVAELYHVKKETVERDIRTAIESTWTNSYSDVQYVYYDSIIPKGKDKPTAAKFIERTVSIIEDQMK